MVANATKADKIEVGVNVGGVTKDKGLVTAVDLGLGFRSGKVHVAGSDVLESFQRDRQKDKAISSEYGIRRKAIVPESQLGGTSEEILKGLEAARTRKHDAKQDAALTAYVKSDVLPDAQQKALEAAKVANPKLVAQIEIFEKEMNKIIAERNSKDATKGQISDQDVIRALYRSVGGNYNRNDKKAFALSDALHLNMKDLLNPDDREKPRKTEDVLAGMVKKFSLN